MRRHSRFKVSFTSRGCRTGQRPPGGRSESVLMDVTMQKDNLRRMDRTEEARPQRFGRIWKTLFLVVGSADFYNN